MSKLQLLSYDTFLELSSRKQYDVCMLEHQRAENGLYTIEELTEEVDRVSNELRKAKIRIEGLSKKEPHEHISMGE